MTSCRFLTVATIKLKMKSTQLFLVCVMEIPSGGYELNSATITPDPGKA